MSITWQEREHEEEDMVSLNDPGTVEALGNCGLLKYLRLSKMRQQSKLLQFLVHQWDLTDQAFHIRDKVVPIVIDDFYFLISFLRHGAPISLSGATSGGETVRDYV